VEARVTERRDHGLWPCPAAEHGDGVIHRDLVVGQELGDGQVVGVVGAQLSVGVDDGVHRPDASAEASIASTNSRQTSL
jgi:hypothetical protein